MRNKPIRRDEIRFNGYDITTLPADSVRKGKRGNYETVRRLWTPLLRSLNRAEGKKTEEWNAKYAAKLGPLGKPKPIACPRPEYKRECWHCNRKFFRSSRIGKSRFCSDRCASLVRSAKHSRAKSAERALARAGRTCENCGAPLQAQRSTRRFCSSYCRVTAHRAALR
jgi:endogenous inhibitor of DNA gyrase (YacG/DUF329 family)